MNSTCRRAPRQNNRKAHCHGYVVPTLLLFMACLIPISASAQSTASRHLTLIHSDEREFEELLNTNFPGMDRLDGYATFRPYLILLRNDASLAVRAYMVVWETKLSTGGTKRTANLIERYDPSPASERVALAPGQFRLISPAFDVSPQEYQSSLYSRNWVATMMSTQQTHRPYSLISTKSITPSVDAAIFADGACVGADHYQVFTRYEREVAAEHDLAEAVLQLLDAKTSEADVVGFLKNELDANNAASTSQGGSASIYAFHRARDAQELLTLYRNGGIENVMTKAWRVTQHPQQKLSRISPE